jgi:hypothetical protein
VSGTLIPSGASRSTRHAGHFGRNAKITDESDDDKNEYAGATVAARGAIIVLGTIPRY